MAYKKITGLTAASAIASANSFELVQSGVSYEATMAQVAASTPLTDAFVAKPAAVGSAATVIAEYIFDEDHELDYSASFNDGSSGTKTFTELPANTVAIWVDFYVEDTATTVYATFKRSTGGTKTITIRASFADLGTNLIRGPYWLPTSGNTIYLVGTNCDTGHTFTILGYKVGA